MGKQYLIAIDDNYYFTSYHETTGYKFVNSLSLGKLIDEPDLNGLMDKINNSLEPGHTIKAIPCTPKSSTKQVVYHDHIQIVSVKFGA